MTDCPDIDCLMLVTQRAQQTHKNGLLSFQRKGQLDLIWKVTKNSTRECIAYCNSLNSYHVGLAGREIKTF